MKRHTIRYADNPDRATLLLDAMADNGWTHYDTVWGGWGNAGRIKNSLCPHGFTLFFHGDETASDAPPMPELEAAAAQAATDAAAAKEQAAIDAAAKVKADAKAARKAAEQAAATPAKPARKRATKKSG